MSNGDNDAITAEPAEPHVAWPKNSTGGYATITELMEEVTEAAEQGRAVTLTFQAYSWIMHAVYGDVAKHHSRPYALRPMFRMHRDTDGGQARESTYRERAASPPVAQNVRVEGMPIVPTGIGTVSADNVV